jgi:hypothetical protein
MASETFVSHYRLSRGESRVYLIALLVGYYGEYAGSRCVADILAESELGLLSVASDVVADPSFDVEVTVIGKVVEEVGQGEFVCWESAPA